MEDNDNGNPPVTISFSHSNANDNESGPTSPTAGNAMVQKGLSIKSLGSRFDRRKTLVKGGKKKNKVEQGNIGKEELARAFFTCKCRVCQDQVTKGHLFNFHKKVDMTKLAGKKIEFQ